jgi:outer membrane protein assembly factor BamD (BamD/ComL family)
MTISIFKGKVNAGWIAMAALLALPAVTRAHASATPVPVAVETWQDQDQNAQEREQEKREREQEARDREQEKRDREQEARDRVQERLDRAQEIYEDAREDLDEDRYERAAQRFKTLADMKSKMADAALYWRAYAENRLGQKDAALAALADLKKQFPQSKWANDATALEMEVRQSTGQRVPIAEDSNCEMKMGLFGGKEALKTLSEVYGSTSDADVKRRIIRSYMLAHDTDHLFAAAKGEKDESLRREAIRQLGLVHGTGELEQLYQAEGSSDVRREILQAFFLAGDSGRIVKAAQGEKDPELRRAAIRNLGLIHSPESENALQEIYNKETDHSLKAEVLNAYFLQGNAHALVQVAKTEKDPELKKTAVSKLSLMHSKEGTDYLMELLQK